MKRLARPFLAVYALLLVASHLEVWRRSGPPPLPADRRAIEVAAIDGETAVAPRKAVRLAYREWQAEADGVPVLLLQGSPGSADDFDGLGPLLAGRRAIAPDLPGFGASTRSVPDYSIRAHAAYVREMLDALAIPQVDVVGFSMGGGVGLELLRQDPERVRSLTLLSAIGLQEMELLGDYSANHAVHALQLGTLWLLRHGVPHFGRVSSMLNVEYARNFYDTDQRPLEAVLRAAACPVLIVHGETDFLVPAEAAREHHRLLPQSRLEMLASDHFMTFREPARLATPILAFLADVDRGVAPTRATADPARVAAAAEKRPLRLPRARGPALVVTSGLLALATSISEDLTCIAGGLLVARGRLSLLAAALGCGIGIFLGDLGLYAIGRLGRGSVEHAPLKWMLSPRDVEVARGWFDRRGALVIFLSRFLPGTRIPTYVTAGVLGMPLGRFALWLFLPVAIWTPLLVGTAALAGESFSDAFDRFRDHAVLGFVLFLVTVWVLLGLGRALSSHRGRRLLVGRWRRLRHWEFWPPWAFYPPVVLWVLWLGLRHRGLTVFTAANPALPAGGFIGESKTDILERLGGDEVARFARLPAGDGVETRLATIRAFQAGLPSPWPIVVKPDVGQRGSGVLVARDGEAVRAYLAAASGDLLVQEHVAGPELGIFYVRLPGDERGRILSVTHKVLPEVVGDGRRSLERLILDDRRAVAMARTYLGLHRDRLDAVPSEGEAVRLVEIGNHCRGAVFLDGARFLTPALEAAVDRVSQRFDGFFFGRYDLRSESLEAFGEGRFRVLELNGVTSEATHIYDPANGLLTAYRVLFEQWALAFEIGGRNRARGVAPTSAGELARALFDFRRRAGAAAKRAT